MQELRLLTDATANTTGATNIVQRKGWRFDFIPRDAGSGVEGTLAVEYQAPDGSWITLESIDFTDETPQTRTYSAPLKTVRGVLSNYQSGIFNLCAEAL